MQFSEFSRQLLNSNSPVFPDNIYAPSESISGIFSSKNIFWNKIAQLRAYTDSSSNNFPEKHAGSTGWEYEMMLVSVIDKLYYSGISTSRNYTQVSSNHSIQIEPDYNAKTGILIDKILIDHKEVGKITYTGPAEIQKREQKIQSGQYSAKFLCHFHSHPQVQIPRLGKRIYTFYSPTDINSLLTSTMPMMGLVTDKVWLLIRPRSPSQIPTPGDLNQVTIAESRQDGSLEPTAAEVMKRYGWPLYVANFKSNFRRIA